MSALRCVAALVAAAGLVTAGSASADEEAAGGFGLRVGFTGAPTPAGGEVASSPFVGVKLPLGDALALLVDAGFGIGTGGGPTAFGFTIGAGLDVYLGSRRSLRPLITGGATFGKPISTNQRDHGLSIAAGGGAEYWFSRHFSVNGRALLAVPVSLAAGEVLLFTLVPGVGATFYF